MRNLLITFVVLTPPQLTAQAQADVETRTEQTFHKERETNKMSLAGIALNLLRDF